MPEALSIALPLTMAAVLIASGITKFRRPDDLSGWAELGVPEAFRRPWLVRLHPWGELVLGAALACLGGWLGLLAALACFALMTGYLLLVWRVLRRADDASCACFGARKRITRVTVARNLWLVLLAAAAASVIWANPLIGGALAGVTATWSWLLAVAVAVVTTALIMWPDSEAGADALSAADAPPVASSADGDEYVRTRTPAVPVTLADGTVVNLRKIAATKPILLLAVSATCGSCTSVIANVTPWRRLLPEVDIRLLLRQAPGESVLTSVREPQSLHDTEGYVSGSIADWKTPTAVLLGSDGLLAGGPASGFDEISAFIEDIHASLHEGDVSAPTPAPEDRDAAVR